MSPEELQRAKSDLRRRIRARLGAVTPGQRDMWSRRILEHLTRRTSWVPREGAVALFGGPASEPDLLPLLPWLASRGVGTAFFNVRGDGRMVPRRVRDQGDLATGAHGVLEPASDSCPELDPPDLAVVLVPGIAFCSEDGARLGRGKGCYDRMLAAPGARAKAIGVGFAMQFLPNVPHGPLDACMDAMLNEDGWTEIRGSGAAR